MLMTFTRLWLFKIDIIILFPSLLHPPQWGWSTVTFRSQCSLCWPIIVAVLPNINPCQFVPSVGKMRKMLEEGQQVVAWAEEWTRKAGSLHLESCFG